jgi:hypothetical protein
MEFCSMSEQEMRDILTDEAYVSSLLALDTPEEVQASLAEKGIDLTEAEITALLQAIQSYVQSGGELSEADLETVTGGFVLMGFLIGLVVATISSAVGAGVVGLIPVAIRRRW